MLIPVILSGGAGTRLWPVSREGHPKPFMKLPDGESLLMKTYRRARRVADPGEILTVTNREYFFLSRDEYQLSLPDEPERPTFLLEPFGRNTAPAIALAALQVADRHGPDALMLVMPADHLISDEPLFGATVGQAAALAAQGYLVTFGIQPTAPETGYGYIEAGEPIPGTGQQAGSGRHVVRFIEKPAREKAEQLLAAGNYLWNSGMFCFAARTMLEALQQHAPDVLHAARACQASARHEHTSHATLLEIVGGQDKGNDYSPLIPYVSKKVRAIVCLGLDNNKIIQTFQSIVPTIIETHSMEDAVQVGRGLAQEGDTVLLSPACASFDLFQSYEDRGNQFKHYVNMIKE